eukprot:TRINITY_DN7095_c0_g1_i1.p1 TRINITY_DN7095_c0_g1~~TRINITY_DN7095_c0_g1_i1.p1  ORF type:complete len:1010 (-),score=164.38 TRINITY_DN7095_c0_g1_i1:219-3248(-)
MDAEAETEVERIQRELCELCGECQNMCSGLPDHIIKRILLQFVNLLQKLVLVLQNLRGNPRSLVVSCTKSLEEEIQSAQSSLGDIQGRSLLYLLIYSSTLLDQTRNFAKKAGAFLENIVLEGASEPLESSVLQAKSVSERIGFEYLDSRDQILCNSFGESALVSIVSDHSLIIKKAEQIAESLKMSLYSEGFRAELGRLREERNEAAVSRGKVHSLYLDQFIALLDIALKAKSGEKKISNASSERRRNHPYHRDVPMLPLQSFICPITKDVMQDPVQIESGQTYERSAIERWFHEGHTRCPTGVELKNTKMKPNYALKQSIEEWRERNYKIRLETAYETLKNSDDTEDKLRAVQDLQSLCEENPLNKYEVAKRDLIPMLVTLTKSPCNLAMKTFSTLLVLAKDNHENQEIMVNNGIIKAIVSCLARQKDEAPQAVCLMRLLSENKEIADKIGQDRNAILFLVPLMEENEFSENVGAILDNLPKSDADVITMAEANIMKPLLNRLNEGELPSKILMCKTLGRLHMIDTNKEFVSTTKTLCTLLEMLSSENEEASSAAIAALQNLSSVPSVCQTIEKINGVQILLHKLKSECSDGSRTDMAHVLANLFGNTVNGLEVEVCRKAQLDDIISIFTYLMGPDTPSSIQYHVLQALIGLTNESHISVAAKRKLLEKDTFALLLDLLDTATDHKFKICAAQLFNILSCTFGSEACSSLKRRPQSLKHFLEMLKDSYLDSDHVIAGSILANLPSEDTHILTMLVQANIMPQLVNFLDSPNDLVVEASLGALLRFSMRNEHQKKLAEMKLVQKLVNLLTRSRSLTKERAATALYYFSRNSPRLAKKLEYTKCWWCFSPQANVCRLHHGVCEVESNYCLLEASAISPLVQLLREKQMSCVLAALNALSTLVDDAVADQETGWHCIAREDGIPQVIGLISSGSPDVQGMCASLCERLLKLGEYKNKYGMTVQMHVIGLAQRGSSSQRQTAGRILRLLEFLDSQSNYFAVSTAGNHNSSPP